MIKAENEYLFQFSKLKFDMDMINLKEEFLMLKQKYDLYKKSNEYLKEFLSTPCMLFITVTEDLNIYSSISDKNIDDSKLITKKVYNMDKKNIIMKFLNGETDIDSLLSKLKLEIKKRVELKIIECRKKLLQKNNDWEKYICASPYLLYIVDVEELFNILNKDSFFYKYASGVTNGEYLYDLFNKRMKNVIFRKKEIFTDIENNRFLEKDTISKIVTEYLYQEKINSAAGMGNYYILYALYNNLVDEDIVKYFLYESSSFTKYLCSILGFSVVEFKYFFDKINFNLSQKLIVEASLFEIDIDAEVDTNFLCYKLDRVYYLNTKITEVLERITTLIIKGNVLDVKVFNHSMDLTSLKKLLLENSEVLAALNNVDLNELKSIIEKNIIE